MDANHQHVEPLWREEDDVKPRKCIKLCRRHPGQPQAGRSDHQNLVWEIDFQFDATTHYHRLKPISLVDEFTCGALAVEVTSSMTSEDLVAVLERLVSGRGAQGHLRIDNRPELSVWAIWDRCGPGSIGTIYIEPRSAG